MIMDQIVVLHWGVVLAVEHILPPISLPHHDELEVDLFSQGSVLLVQVALHQRHHSRPITDCYHDSSTQMLDLHDEPHKTILNSGHFFESGQLMDGARLNLVAIFGPGESVRAIFVVVHATEITHRDYNQQMQRVGRQRFLDVSEYVLKEHSPVYKPSSNNISHTLHREATPEIGPIDHDTTAFVITPVFHPSRIARDELMREDDDFTLEIKQRRRPYRPRSSSLRLVNQEDSLDRIVEESDIYNHSLGQHYDEDFSQFSPSPILRPQERVSQASESEVEDIASPQRESPQEACPVFFNEYTGKLKRFFSDEPVYLLDAMREQSSLSSMYNLLKEYLTNYETYCFEEAWESLRGTITEKIAFLNKGVASTLQRKVGSLCFETRRQKLLVYLEKKKRRREQKKVVSSSHKKVADTRLRLKGKFVTRRQVCEQLGMPNLIGLTPAQIKALLENKLDVQDNI